MTYLDENKTYWEDGYTAANVDHPVFRFYGRILKSEFGIRGDWARLVDFGCGQGAAVSFFSAQGFNARGVDVSEHDIAVAKYRYPHISHAFAVCDPNPELNESYGFSDDVVVVTAIQALYYLSDQHFSVCMEKIYSSMKSGGVFFATMMGEACREFFDNSKEYEGGLRVVRHPRERRECCIAFTKDEDHLKKKFRMFQPRHVGYYAAKFRSDEGDGFHFTFCGVKA